MRKILFALTMLLPLFAAAQTTAPMGILVSQRQGTVDWPTVHEENDLDFVYVMTTFGAAKTDERCGQNIERAFQAGFPVGCVHRYDRHFSAQGQLDNFKAAVKGFHMSLAPAVYVVVDAPYDINVKRFDMLLQLMEEEYGVKPLIMANQEAYLRYFSLERYAGYHVIIVSNGLRFPDTRYSIWEYTDKEKVAGIVEYVPGLKLNPTYKIENLKIKN
ncbi:MAG: hypothetical protein MJZ77_07475 [Bacteroidales bacterium]|nr:hypothetical protein [Bacteroidales bacterium]